MDLLGFVARVRAQVVAESVRSAAAANGLGLRPHLRQAEILKCQFSSDFM